MLLTMSDAKNVQLSCYVKPETATAIKRYVVAQSGSMRSLSPWIRDAVLAKAKAEGIDISAEEVE